MAAPIIQPTRTLQGAPNVFAQGLSTLQSVKQSGRADTAAKNQEVAQKTRQTLVAREQKKFNETTEARRVGATSYLANLNAGLATYDADKDITAFSAVNASLNFLQTANQGSGTEYSNPTAFVAKLQARENERQNPAASKILDSFMQEYSAPNGGFDGLADELEMEKGSISNKGFVEMMKSPGAAGVTARAWFSDFASETEKTNFELLTGTPMMGTGKSVQVVHRGGRRVAIGPNEIAAYNTQQVGEAALREKHSPDVASRLIKNMRQVADLNAESVAKNALSQATLRSQHPWATKEIVGQAVLNPHGSENMELVSAAGLDPIASQRLASQLNGFGMHAKFVTNAKDPVQMERARNASLQHAAWVGEDPVGASVFSGLVQNGAVTDYETAQSWRMALKDISPEVALRIPDVAANPQYKALAADTTVIQTLARLDAAGGGDVLSEDSSVAIQMAEDPTIQQQLAGFMQREVRTLDKSGSPVMTTAPTRVNPGAMTRIFGRAPKDVVELSGMLDQMKTARENMDGKITSAEEVSLHDRYKLSIKNTSVSDTEAEALAADGLVQHSELISMVTELRKGLTVGVQTFETGVSEEAKQFEDTERGQKIAENTDAAPGTTIATGEVNEGREAFKLLTGDSGFKRAPVAAFDKGESRAQAMTILDDPKKVKLVHSFFAAVPTADLVTHKAKFVSKFTGDPLLGQVAADVANVYIEQRRIHEGSVDLARALDFLDPKRPAGSTTTPGVGQEPELTKTGASRYNFVGGSTYTISKDEETGADVHTFMRAGGAGALSAPTKDELFVQVEHEARVQGPALEEQIKAGQAIGLLDSGAATYYGQQLRDVRGKMPDSMASFMAGETSGDVRAAVRDLTWAFGAKKAGRIISSRGDQTIPEAMAASVEDADLVAKTRDTLAAVIAARSSIRLGTVLHSITQEQLGQLYSTDRSLVVRDRSTPTPNGGPTPTTYSINRDIPMATLNARIRELTFNAARYSLYANKETK